MAKFKTAIATLTHNPHRLFLAINTSCLWIMLSCLATIYFTVRTCFILHYVLGNNFRKREPWKFVLVIKSIRFFIPPTQLSCHDSLMKAVWHSKYDGLKFKQILEQKETKLMSLAFLFPYLMLNMFRMLIHPSSIVQHISCKLLKMDVLTSETWWALNNEIKKQVISSSSLFIQLSRCCTVQ